MNNVMNSVTHQKNMLSKNHRIKLWPLFFAIVAGKSANATHKMIPRMSANTLNVYPKKVVANIIIRIPPNYALTVAGKP